jgi:hypothetical protein
MKAELEVDTEENYVNQKTVSKVRTVCIKKGATRIRNDNYAIRVRSQHPPTQGNLRGGR